MNKEQLQLLVESLNLLKEEYYILGSGSLLLHGLRDIANDLDICVTPQAFETLKQQYDIDMNSQNNCGFYPVTPIIEVVVNEKKNFDCDFQDGYPVEKLEKILAFKQGRNKPKDKLDIENITKYLEQRNKVKHL